MRRCQQEALRSHTQPSPRPAPPDVLPPSDASKSAAVQRMRSTLGSKLTTCLHELARHEGGEDGEQSESRSQSTRHYETTDLRAMLKERAARLSWRIIGP